MPDDALREVVAHYQAVEEDVRLGTGVFQLEFVRTKELILRHLPPAPTAIVDAGGGSGPYAFWLAELGYQVHLLDPVPKHIEQAKRRLTSGCAAPLAGVTLGDARELPFDDGSQGAVLLLGPLYHLTERNERLACLGEARRVLRTGGLVFAAAISRFASLLAALHEDLINRDDFVPIIERDLRDGQHRNDTGNPEYFTTAFFHRPSELTEEIVESGLKLLDLLPVEGPGWLASNFEQVWASEKQRQRLLALVRQVENKPELLGASAHLIAIAQK